MLKDRIIVAMSGGVDSSVTAALLKSRGHRLTGIFLRSGHSEETTGGKGCCTVEDANDARIVAARLGIPFYVLSLRDGFERLVQQFVSEYVAGRTPSPCVLCNQWLKFGALLDYARGVGAQAVATGHYARVEHYGARPVLRRGRDASKDQSYFLFSLTSEQLGASLFPLGDLTKPKVRELAGQFELPVREKAESQDICFVPEGGYAELIEKLAPGSLKPGPIQDQEGRLLGEHRGIGRYTIGQRRGLGISSEGPRYVTHIDANANSLTLGPAEGLLRTRMHAERVNWLVDPSEQERPLRADVQIRYRSRPEPATITPLPGNEARVVFDSPVRAIAPGQAAVFYDEDRVLGGGWIRHSGRDAPTTAR